METCLLLYKGEGGSVESRVNGVVIGMVVGDCSFVDGCSGYEQTLRQVGCFSGILWIWVRCCCKLPNS